MPYPPIVRDEAPVRGLTLLLDSRDCAFRVEADIGEDEPVSGGGPTLADALENLAWVLRSLRTDAPYGVPA